MKKIFVITIFLISFYSFGQTKEFGFSIGTMLYKGELAPQFNILNAGPGVTGFFRHNISPVIDLKYQVQLGQIYGNDARSSFPMAKQRGSRFKNTIFELDALMEYNFLNYRESPKTFIRSVKWTPYLALGLGFMLHNRINNASGIFSPTLPMGVGVKWILSKQWNLGAEFIARKTFTDGLDGYGKSDTNNIQLGFNNDMDLTSFLGVSLSYTLYGVHCPENNSGYSHPSH